MSIVNNIGSLKQDLANHNWHMTAFLFNYKNIEYDVLFENNENIEKRTNKLASVLLTFIDIKNPTRVYTIEANQKRMFFNSKEFREFFGIKYSENLGDIFKQFYGYFVGFVPQTVPPVLNKRQEEEIDHRLVQREGRDPNAIYCFDARRLGKRNGNQKHRSIFISNLTERKKPELYAYFKDEPTVTFYYSTDPAQELDSIEIIDKFRRRESQEPKE